MPEGSRRKTQSETIELTELLVIHGDSLSGTDQQKQQKLERIREALRQREIDFVDQEEAFEVWVSPADKQAVLEMLSGLGYQADVFEL